MGSLLSKIEGEQENLKLKLSQKDRHAASRYAEKISKKRESKFRNSTKSKKLRKAPEFWGPLKTLIATAVFLSPFVLFFSMTIDLAEAALWIIFAIILFCVWPEVERRWIFQIQR